MPYQINKETMDKLQRMRSLNAIIGHEYDPEEDIFAEYKTLLEDLREDFMPLMELLIKTGLITVSIHDPEGEFLEEEYIGISGTPMLAFENGSICLDAVVDGACYRYKHKHLEKNMNRYETLWRNKWVTAEATTIGEMIAMLEGAAQTLREMEADGIMLDPDGGTGDDYATLYTDNEEVAKKHGLEKEDWYNENEE